MEQLYDSFKNPKREYAIYPIITARRRLTAVTAGTRSPRRSCRAALPE